MIIPVAAEFFALRGVALLMQSIDKVQSRINPSLEVYGVLVTMYTRTLHCEEVLQLIEEGKIDTTPLITHRFPLSRIAEAYSLFENKEDGVIKVAIYND